MNQFIARMAYYQSVLMDQSEFPVSKWREKERKRLLKKRIGEKKFIKWIKKYHMKNDPALFVCLSKWPLLIISFIIFLWYFQP